MFSALLLVLAMAADPSVGNEVQVGGKTILLHPKVQVLPAPHLGPFVKRGDGKMLAVDNDRVLVSADEGRTWTGKTLFKQADKYQCREERALLRTRDGVLVLAFLNNREMAFRWDQTQGGPQAGCRLPAYTVRSLDDGETWEEPHLLQDGYCGALRSMIQLRSGRVVLGCQQAVANPGRHVCLTYICEHVPGEMWVTTMQGPLRIKVQEDDFLPRRRSDDTYPVRWLPLAKIELDGRADEADWTQAKVEKRFVFPWKQAPSPATEFRALCTEQFLYFTFHSEDHDIVVLEQLRDEEDAVFEDRAELYFCRDEQMQDYYCIEVDSRGRVFDYRGAYYRQLDPKWNWPGLQTKASPLERGYVIEGRIPLASFARLGFPALRPGVKIRCGLFRAEFSHDRSGKPVVARESLHNRGRRLDGPPPIEEWMAWIDPHTEEPDFHVPTSLGWLEIVP